MPTDCNAAGHSHSLDPPNQTDQLTALAREARLLEIGLEGGGDAARQLATDLERALTTAMDAESPGELTQARTAIDLVLGRVLSQGMCLSAELADMEVKGVLGMARMPVLTAVLSAPIQRRR
jgi:hypothetical protein